MEEDYIPMGSAAADAASRNATSEAAVLLDSLKVPWIRRKNTATRGVPPLVRLHNEIMDYASFISLNAEEKALRDSAFSDLQDVVSELWPLARCEIFGSGLTGILTPHSDLDIAILDVPFGAAAPLTALADAIRRKGLASYLEVITSARTPIIKMDHRFSGLSVDILVNNDSGLRTGASIRRLANDYPPLRPLTLVLKIFLQQRHLGDTFTGGIGSFVLSCMVVSFLQQRERAAAAQGRRARYNLGGLLLEFLELYGGSFNYYHVGISINGAGRYYNKQQQQLSAVGVAENEFFNPTRPLQMLSVENPEDVAVDMGKNTRHMPKIRRAFEHAKELLSHALCDGGAASSGKSLLSYIIRPDDPLLAEREIHNEASAQQPQQRQQEDADVRPAKRARKRDRRRQKAALEALHEETQQLEQELTSIAEQRAVLDRRRAELDARLRKVRAEAADLEAVLAD